MTDINKSSRIKFDFKVKCQGQRLTVNLPKNCEFPGKLTLTFDLEVLSCPELDRYFGGRFRAQTIYSI